MEQSGLIRRDEIGKSVVYSPTALTRICLQWVEKEDNMDVAVPFGLELAQLAQVGAN